MAITIGQLAGYLDAEVKKGNGGLEVYLASHDGQQATPLLQGDILNTPLGRVFVMKPQKPYKIEANKLT